jgi:hypothetical protein
MLVTGIFPQRLKFSEIKPIYKKRDIRDSSNYRPISLLSSISKREIFEKVIYNRIQQHIKTIIFLLMNSLDSDIHDRLIIRLLTVSTMIFCSPSWNTMG